MAKILLPGNEGIHQLIRDLRSQKPKGFIWDFGTVMRVAKDDPQTFKECYGISCGTAGCAMGLARYLYENTRTEDFNFAEHLGMVDDTEDAIFWNLWNYYESRADEITPDMVADALERFLKEGDLPFYKGDLTSVLAL